MEDIQFIKLDCSVAIGIVVIRSAKKFPSFFILFLEFKCAKTLKKDQQKSFIYIYFLIQKTNISK
jgi:hypothetical protein